MSELEELKAELDRIKTENYKREIELEKKRLEEAKAKEKEEEQRKLRDEIRAELLSEIETTKSEDSKLNTLKSETLNSGGKTVVLAKGTHAQRTMPINELKKETADYINGELYHFYQSQGYKELPPNREVTGNITYEDMVKKLVMKSKRRGRVN